MPDAFMVLWLSWAVAIAFSWRVVLRRFVFKGTSAGSWLATYAVMLCAGIAGVVVSEWLGFRLYGYDPDDPWQFVAAGLLLYSPVGLPLLVGLLPVLFYDLIRPVYSRS